MFVTFLADNAGGAIGLYPNGLRVVKDISPELLDEIRAAGYPYIYRRWMRHDGTEVACAKESTLCDNISLQSIGIRRWKLQKVLTEASLSKGIRINFGKRLRSVEALPAGRYQLTFEDDSQCHCDVLFGADGIRSKVRECLFGETDVGYTGITCLMGAADLPRPFRGICFPSSSTSKCHACYYPTGSNEQVFQVNSFVFVLKYVQLFFPAEEKPETWGNLSPKDAEKECLELANRLEADGWNPDFIAPLRAPKSVIRVGLRSREPSTSRFKGKIVLLGDSAAPPQPYIGQGAMGAFEDAGVISLLIQRMCVDKNGKFTLDNFENAMRLYEQLRIPRATKILNASKSLGTMQQNRAESTLYNLTKEWSIWLQVKYYGTLPIMFEGASFDYKEETLKLLKNRPVETQTAKL